MGLFKAGTQYGDWKGTAAADCYQGSPELEDYLKGKGLLNPGETCFAISLSVGENQVGRMMTVHGGAYLVDGENVDEIQERFDATSGPIPTREVRFKMTHDDFVSVFKRFEVVLILRGLKIEDREFTVAEA